jgi:hypothetical protein
MRLAGSWPCPSAEGRDWRGPKPEEIKMRTYSLTELFRLSRAELFALHAQIVAALALLPDDAPERPALLAALGEVRRALATARWPSP